MAAASLRPKPRPGVLDIEAYVPGRSAAQGVEKIYKLSSNETPLGPSPKALDAFKSAMQGLEFYPDGTSTKLREAIAAKYGLDADRILCGSGSDELLSLLANAYIGPGDEGVMSQYGFLVYPIAVRAAGGMPVVAKERDFQTDVDAMLKAVTRAHQDRLSRQSEQPDRNLHPLQRGQAFARRAAAPCPAGPRCRLRRICAAQRLCFGPRARLDERQRRDDPYLLEDFRPRQSAHRLALRAGACRRRPEPHPQRLQRQRGRARGRRRGDRR